MQLMRRIETLSPDKGFVAIPSETLIGEWLIQTMQPPRNIVGFFSHLTYSWQPSGVPIHMSDFNDFYQLLLTVLMIELEIAKQSLIDKLAAHDHIDRRRTDRTT